MKKLLIILLTLCIFCFSGCGLNMNNVGKKPSFSGKVLEVHSGYILVDGDGLITLTETGLEIAQKIYERHTVLTQLLIRLGVTPETAASDACKIEHAMSDETFDAIKNHVKQYG